MSAVEAVLLGDIVPDERLVAVRKTIVKRLIALHAKSTVQMSTMYDTEEDTELHAVHLALCILDYGETDVRFCRVACHYYIDVLLANDNKRLRNECYTLAVQNSLRERLGWREMFTALENIVQSKGERIPYLDYAV